MKIELVVFDIAGTTVADNGNVNQAFRGSLEKAGYPVPEAAVNHVMGYRKIEAIKILLKQFYPGKESDDLLVDNIHQQFTEDMQAHYQHTPGLHALPYATEMFKLLHANNIKVALDTGFTKIITGTIIDRLGWSKDGLVDAVISSDEVPEGRPHPFMIQALMNQLQVTDAKQVVKIGDTEVDIAEGRNAGCGLVIAVTSGAYQRDELALHSPDHLIDQLSELPAILNLQA